MQLNLCCSPPKCREELQFFLPEADYPADAHVAHLIAKHPQKGGTWKEVYVFRHHKMVHCKRKIFLKKML